MNRHEFERLLREHLRPMHEEIETLFRDRRRAFADLLTSTLEKLAELGRRGK